MKNHLSNLMIRASAGSGKTYQLSLRWIALLALEVDPKKIAALTFTKKAATEFLRRIFERLTKASETPQAAKKLGEEVTQVLIGSKNSELIALWQGATQEELVTLGLDRVETWQKHLIRMVESLDELTLSTLDGFFAQMVRQQLFDLGLIQFQLIEPGREFFIWQEALINLLNQSHWREDQKQDFLRILRQRKEGKESAGFGKLAEDFIKDYQNLFCVTKQGKEWGNEEDLWKQNSPWKSCPNLDQTITEVRGLVENQTDWSDELKRVVQKILNEIGEKNWGGLTNKVFWERWTSSYADLLEGKAILKQRKDYEIKGELAIKMGEIASHILGVLLGKIQRTSQGEYQALLQLDNALNQRYRKNGQWAIADVANQLAKRAKRIEQSDQSYQLLDQQIDHWLLDEFQDTNRLQWSILEPLIDEVVQDDEGRRSLFVVGDPKQSIYSWRGGDSRLFGQLNDHYQSGLTEVSMAKSWRCSPVILDVINQLFDEESALLKSLPEARYWKFDKHIAAKSLKGHVRIEAFSTKGLSYEEEVLASMTRQLIEVEPIQRGLSVAILCVTQKQVKKCVNYLKESPEISMPIIVDRKESLLENSPLAIACLNLFRWLNSPNQEGLSPHLFFTPIYQGLVQLEEINQDQLWASARKLLENRGIVCFVQQLVEKLVQQNLGGIDRNRLDKILQLALNFVPQDNDNLAEWVRYLEKYELKDSFQGKAIEIMTIHQAKGLEFDWVIFADFDKRNFDGKSNLKFFKESDKEGWIVNCWQKPAKEVWQSNPWFKNRYDEWLSEIVEDRLCALYVTLTRAKQALSLFIKQKDEKAIKEQNFSAWMSRVFQTQLAGKSGLLSCQLGCEKWYQDKEKINFPEQSNQPTKERLKLPIPKPRIPAKSPSKGKVEMPSDFQPRTLSQKSDDSLSARQLGIQVHELLKSFTWDIETWKTSEDKQSTEAVELVENFLNTEGVKTWFESQKAKKLHTEIAFEVILEGCWVSGMIDRLHLQRDNSSGEVLSATIIDWKTDQIAPEKLIESYREQLTLYQQAICQLYDLPPNKVQLFLASIVHREMIGLNWLKSDLKRIE